MFNALRKHKEQTGKVYGAAVNKKRKRYCKDLKTGVVHDRNGNPVFDKETGEIVELTPRQKSYRAGYADGVSESTAAAKTAAGLDTRGNHSGLVKIDSTAIVGAFAVPGKAGAKVKK